MRENLAGRPRLNATVWLGLAFEHSATHCRGVAGDQLMRFGDTTWSAFVEGAEVLLHWEWREVRPCVLAVANVLDVVTNVALVDSDGRELLPTTLLLRAVHELPWEPVVLSALKADRH